MKKTVSILTILLLVVPALFAADRDPVYNWQNGTVSGAADVLVSVDTSNETQKCIVGFTNVNPETTDSSIGVASSVGNPADNVVLTINKTDGKAHNGADKELYLYYQIASHENIVIKLYEEKLLTGALASGADTVKWEVTTDGDIPDLYGETTGEDSAVTIYEHEPTTKTWGAADSIKLDIGTTESLWDKKADNYTSNLIVAISVDSHKE